MTKNPKVFISYSHDSPEHQQWVSELALRLRRNGIDVVFDQWDIGMGSDITRFMQRGIVDSDSVLVICTDQYGSKANTGEGGVGYEQMVINTQIVQHLGIDKFIPIIRKVSGPEQIPTFLRDLVYLDFTNDNQFDEKFAQLIHALRNKSILQKPPPEESSLYPEQELPPDIPQHIETASEAYTIGAKLARLGDVLGWRQLVKDIRPNVFESLVQWRQNELDVQRPETKEQLTQAVDKAVEIISPLMAVALVGVESGREEFRNQKSLIDDLQNIVGWNPAGYEVWIRLPNALGYVYHSLHGGICLSTNQIDLAIGLARVKIPVAINTGGTKFFHLWEMGEFRGYPISISGTRGGNSLESWDYLANAYNRWNWLSSIFETESEYQTSLVAYYMSLNIHELATVIAADRTDTLKTGSGYWFQIPLTFLFQDYDITIRATSLLRRNPEVLMAIWTCLNVTREQIENSWDDWTNLVEKELSKLVFSKPYNPEALLNLSDIYQHLFEGM